MLLESIHILAVSCLLGVAVLGGGSLGAWHELVSSTYMTSFTGSRLLKSSRWMMKASGPSRGTWGVLALIVTYSSLKCITHLHPLLAAKQEGSVPLYKTRWSARTLHFLQHHVLVDPELAPWSSQGATCEHADLACPSYPEWKSSILTRECGGAAVPCAVLPIGWVFDATTSPIQRHSKYSSTLLTAWMRNTCIEWHFLYSGFILRAQKQLMN